MKHVFNLVNYRDRLILMSGGYSSAFKTKDMLATVERYDVLQDAWFEDDTPDLNVGRYNHSSCSLGNKVYIFGGVSFSNQDLNSIESLDAEKLLQGEQTHWVLIRTTI